MKRTFNFTGRRRISRDDAKMVLIHFRDTWSFDANLALAAYNFPRNAEVWVEAHRQNLWMQWFWGTVSALRPPTDRKLYEFEVPDGVLFRVRVVQPPGQEHHKLLGEADGINFVVSGEKDDHRRHLLVPVPESLGQQLWRINFDDDPPSLLVNKDVKPSWRDMARSPQFIALVYPEVFRRLLMRVVITESWTEDDEEIGWQSDWMKFAKNLVGPSPLPAPEHKPEREQWIEDAVTAFCQKLQLRSTWDNLTAEEGIK